MIDERNRNRIHNLAKIIEDQARDIRSLTMESAVQETKVFLIIVESRVIETRPTFERANNFAVELLKEGLTNEVLIAPVMVIINNPVQ